MPLSHGQRFLIQGVNWIPVFVIHLIAGWSYYAYAVKLCVYTVENNKERISYLVVFHIIFLMLMWSIWKTIFTRPAVPTKVFRLPKEEKEQFEKAARSLVQHEILKRVARGLPVLTQTPGGTVRYCDHCRVIKPDRCHHCIRCETCVLKRDHHCPWVNNCVGFSNHKYFVLFIGYGIFYSLVIAATSLKYFIKFATQQLPANHAKLHVIFMCPLASIFFTGFLGFFSYHLWLVGKNRTSTEVVGVPVFRNGPDKNGFSLGVRKNVAEVFGEQKICWLCPVFSSLGDGQSFGTRLVDTDLEQGIANGQQWLAGGEEV